MADSTPPLFSDPVVAAQVAHVEEVPPREAAYSLTQSAFHPELAARMELAEIRQLYRHQALAYDAFNAGRDLVVTTGTNSGKTLCYNLPAIQACLREPVARCLYLFPTKALAQDQLGRLETLAPPSVRVGTYDGDTPKTQRSSLRKMAHILLTNPDMLHIGILPSHDMWAKFLKSLRVIVIDEMHVYRGVFGSNVGNVIRRLLRLCEWHRARPQIIACSATIGNPGELFQRLTGRNAEIIDQDGSPSGKRTFVFWNPPELAPGNRMSANVATSEILASLCENGMRTLAFSRARVSAELVLRYGRKRVEEAGVVAPDKLESYRAGYTVKERRGIEQALFKGKLLGLSATNAMELGVDVGALDAVVINGYPGTSSSFWQQAGRAGRGTKDGLAVFVAHDDPLEQFLVRKPELLLKGRNEAVGANPENPTILSQHLLCAAHERPIAPSELEMFGSSALELAESLDRTGELQFQSGLFYYPAVEPPAMMVDIRGTGGEQVRLILDGNELGTMEFSRALTSAYEGAIYLHRGSTFLVTEFDIENRRAQVIPFDANYYTQAIVQSVIDPKVRVSDAPLGRRCSLALGGISVTDLVTGFRKKSLDGDTVISVEDLEMPPTNYETVAVRFDLPPLDVEEDMESQLGAIHGLEHALMAIAPLLAGCDRGDLGSAWYAAFPDTMRPAVFVFDKTPGGVGLVEKLFDSRSGWLQGALQLLATCDCDSGCPGCLLSPRCEVSNEALDKFATVRLIEKLLGP